MKLFTRLAGALLIAALPVLTAFAATTTVQVGDNFYRANGSTGLSVTITITAGDFVTWTNVGRGFHPTASNTGLWATFPMNPGAPDRTIQFNTPGTFGYYCTAHGAPNQGQFGTIIVQRSTATADEARLAGLALNLFPNPSKGLVTLTLGKVKAGPAYQLRLSNIIGQEVRSVALRPDLSEAGLVLDLRGLPAGMYLCSLLADGKVLNTKRLTLQE